MRRVALLAVSGLLLAGLGSAGAFRADVARDARPLAAFRLPDPDGKQWSLADLARDSKAVVVLFLGTQCPLNNAYMPRLAELHREYSARGVRFVAINSNVGDTPAKITAHAREHKLPFPVLKDAANAVADQYGAKRTPEAFVLTPDRVVVYQGRIDDQFGLSFKRPAPTSRDLAVALDEVLAGKKVSQPRTTAPGCIIARAIKPAEKGSVTFTKHVAPILQKSCQECHRPGQIGPMPLLTYEDAVAWQGMVREVVEEKRMPPWHADPRHGKFKNDRSLSPEDRKALLDWIEQGCPRGDLKDMPRPREFAEGWRIGKPDVVFSMARAQTVPARAGPRGIAYRYFVVDTRFTEDRWIERAEAKPGAREVVHHIIVYIAEPGKGLLAPPRPAGGDGRDGIGRGFLVAYAPGDMPLVLEPGRARKIPKGAILLFQMHYTPDGVERSDRSSVGLVFAKKPPTQEVNTRSVAQRRFVIPPGAANHEVRSSTTFDKDVDLLNLFPHMHLRGKDFEYTAVFPDGKRQVLLRVPRYDFGWQSTYVLDRPLRLPAGSQIECVAHFDNSEGNPNNPDPKSAVRWGEQTWEEMMIGFVDYAPVK